MKEKILIIFGLLSLIVSLSPNPLFLNAIKEQISQEKIPSTINSLVRNLKFSSVREISQSINYSEIEEIKTLDLPDEVKELITKIIFEKDKKVYTFFFEIEKGKSDFTEGVLAISLDNNIINFTYIESVATCSLTQQYEDKKTTKCTRDFFGELRCKPSFVKKKREFTEEEKKLIELGLKEKALKGITSKIKELEITLELTRIPQKTEYSQYSDEDLILTEGAPRISDNKKYFLRFEKNGEIVLYKDNCGAQVRYEQIWSSKSKEEENNSPYYLILESYGYLRVINKNRKVIWASPTPSREIQPFGFNLYDYGYFCVINGHYEDVWCNNE